MICPRCGAETKVIDKRYLKMTNRNRRRRECRRCGYRFTTYEEVDEVRYTDAVMEKVARKLAEGKTITEIAKELGVSRPALSRAIRRWRARQAWGTVEPLWFCPRCWFVVPKGAEKCPRCGVRFDKGEAS